MLDIHQPAPLAAYQATTGDGHLQDHLGQTMVLFFYPKDHTPGCTIEAKDFRDHYSAFSELNTLVFGISRDSLSSHQKFASKHSLPFGLIADVDGHLCTSYGVFKEKSMFGKSFLGIERSTFIIDANGSIAALWRKVKVKDHVTEVLERLRSL